MVKSEKRKTNGEPACLLAGSEKFWNCNVCFMPAAAGYLFVGYEKILTCPVGATLLNL